MSKPYTKAMKDVARLERRAAELRTDLNANPDHLTQVIRQRDKRRRDLARLRRLACEIFEGLEA